MTGDTARPPGLARGVPLLSGRRFMQGPLAILGQLVRALTELRPC